VNKLEENFSKNSITKRQQHGKVCGVELDSVPAVQKRIVASRSI
jgi:hypothetical protein